MPVPLPEDSFGKLLKFLRRRARLTQRDLAQAVGYTEAHICRLENGERLPDLTTVAALFVPALELRDDPRSTNLLLHLAQTARAGNAAPVASPRNQAVDGGMLEEIPAPAPYAVARPRLLERLGARLASERCLALCGLPGMGKTTLAAELARQQTGSAPVFWLTLTRGVNLSTAAVMRQLALFLLAYGQEAPRPLLAPAELPSALSPPERQAGLVGSALARLAAQGQPPLLCFDNFELVNDEPALVALLAHLAATTPARWLVTSRTAVSLPGFANLMLGGLEPAEGQALVERMAGEALHPLLVENLLARTDNPMLLRLALGQMLDEQADPVAFLMQLESQAQVSQYLLETVQRQLSPAGWRLLERVAVFRQPVNLNDALLVELDQEQDEHGDWTAGLAELQQRHLVDHPGRARLHPLIRDYVYAALERDPPQRRRWHLLAARWYERGSGDVLEAAYHYSRAGRAALSVELLASQEELLIQRGQALAAAELLEQLQRQVVTPNLLRQLYATHGYLLSGSLRSAEAERSYHQALSLAAQPGVRAALVYRLAQVLVQRNAYAEVLAAVQQAAGALDPADTLLRARLALSEASAEYNLTHFEASHQAASLALQLAGDLQGVALPLLEEIRAQAHYLLANAARIRRNPAASFEQIQQALLSARRGGLARLETTALGFLGGLHFDQGNLEESLRFRGQALERKLETGDQYGAAYLMIYLCANHLVICETAAALARLDQARAILEQLGDADGLADQDSLRVTCLLLQGQVTQAQELIERLLRSAEYRDKPRMYGYYLNKQAIVQLVQAQPQAAQATLQRALEFPVAAQDRMLRFELSSNLALACLVLGEPALAHQALEQAPPGEGLSLWTRLDRQIISGFVALAEGRPAAAAQVAAQVLEQAAIYPRYRQRATRLAHASAWSDSRPALPAAIPWLMWVEALPPELAFAVEEA